MGMGIRFCSGASGLDPRVLSSLFCVPQICHDCRREFQSHLLPQGNRVIIRLVVILLLVATSSRGNVRNNRENLSVSELRPVLETPQEVVNAFPLFRPIAAESPEDRVQRLWTLADAGDPIAAYGLGVLYEAGLGVDKDLAIAMQWHRIAAEKGVPAAQNRLAIFIENGHGNVQGNPDEAVVWYRKAAEKGFITAQVNLGLSLTAGSGTPVNLEEALQWFRKAAEGGSGEAVYQVAVAYLKGRSVQPDQQEAMKWFKRAADMRVPPAFGAIAVMLGESPEAATWAERGARLGDPLSELQLAMTIWYGENGKDRAAEAFTLLRSSAEKRFPFAAAFLGEALLFGWRTPKNETAAIPLLTLAAERNVARAQALLGGCYAKGTGVAVDYKAAHDWYSKAVLKEEADAMCGLGDIYRNGWGVPVDMKEAYRWYLKAGTGGNVLAQYIVGAMYCEGTGVERNYIEGIKWLSLAQKGGMKLATQALEKIETVAKDPQRNAQITHNMAVHGDAAAQAKFGSLLLSGKGVKKDSAQALRWFRKSAEQNDSEGQYRLGLYYLRQAEQKDLAQGVTWITKAAVANHPRAQYELGMILRYGNGVVADQEQSRHWLDEAAKKGIHQGE